MRSKRVDGACTVILEQLFPRIKAQLTGKKVQPRVRLKDGKLRTLPKNKFFISHNITKVPATCVHSNVQNNGSSPSRFQFYDRQVLPEISLNCRFRRAIGKDFAGGVFRTSFLISCCVPKVKM